MHILSGAERPVLSRKIVWIAVAAIVLFLALAKAAFSGGPLPVGGMMPPDGGGPYKSKIVQKAGSKTYTYDVSRQATGVFLVKRNGSAWLTLRRRTTSGTYEISDPNGTGQAVLKLNKL